jgi:hypothetical protein
MNVTLFDFNNEEKQLFLEYINEDILLNIGRLNVYSAILYFTNDMFNLINIPSNLVIYEYENEKKYNKKKVLKMANTQTFLLHCNNNYIIEYNEITFNIKSNITWDISSSC